MPVPPTPGHPEDPVLILGATSGIGRALTLELRAHGRRVIAAGRRQDLLDTLGGETLRLDVTAPDALDAIAPLAPKTIVYNAGFGERTPTPDWPLTRQTLAVNVVAFERLAQWALDRCAVFAATASVAGIRGLEGTNGYAASKAYMLNAMEGYRRLARHGRHPCRYLTLIPGFVDTAMGQASAFWRCSPATAARHIRRALARHAPTAHITPRWALIATLLRLLPRALFERIPLRA